jgi:hypothetical protein
LGADLKNARTLKQKELGGGERYCCDRDSAQCPDRARGESGCLKT